MLKGNGTEYVPDERKEKWIKLKPEYIEVFFFFFFLFVCLFVCLFICLFVCLFFFLSFFLFFLIKYNQGLVDTLDLLVLGGYYGRGSVSVPRFSSLPMELTVTFQQGDGRGYRAGIVSHFLLGVKAPPGSCPHPEGFGNIFIIIWLFLTSFL